MKIILFAGNIEQWRLPGDPARRTKIDAPGDDLSKGQYFFETTDSPAINLLFAALFDLIICRTTKMGLFVQSPPEGCTLDAVFAQKNPKIQDGEDEKWFVGANILAYLKLLIYTTSFQGPKCGAVRRRFRPVNNLSAKS